MLKIILEKLDVDKFKKTGEVVFFKKKFSRQHSRKYFI